MRVSVKNVPLAGTVRAIPSKSATHRALILQRLAGGSVKNPLKCADTDATLRCLGAFEQNGVMDAGESATTLRLMLPVAIARYGSAVFRADNSLMRRPLDAFVSLGISITRDGPYIRASGRLKRGDYTVDSGVSSQFASGLMLALAYLGGGSVTLSGEPKSMPYIAMSVDMLRRFGVQVEASGNRYDIRGSLAPANVTVEGDWSHAANFFAANALGGSVRVEGLDTDTLQGDSAIAELLERHGGADVSDTPDLLPCLMAAACGRASASVFTGTRRLKHKESDRPRAMADVINALGGKAAVTDECVTVEGTGRLAGGVILAGDHRIAMAAAIAAAVADSPVIIEGAQCTDKSAPDFWRDIRSLGGLMDG